MLRCSACVLSQVMIQQSAARCKVNLTFLQCKSESDFIKVGECPLDPGGYFIIKVFTQNCSARASAFVCAFASMYTAHDATVLGH